MLIPDVLRAPRNHSSPDVVNGVAVAILLGDVNDGKPGAQHQCAFGLCADYSAAVASVKTITFKKGTSVERTGPLTLPTLSKASTHLGVASTAFEYMIDSVTYGKAAVASTALAAGTIPADKWGIYRFSINAAGTITVTAGAVNFTTGYNSEALAIAALPTLPASSADMGYVTVLTASGQPFIGGTDALETGTGGNPSDDTNYVQATSVAPSTTLLVLRWDFTAGPCYLPLPGVLRSDRGGSISVELEASGGAQSGRITLFGCLV